MLSPSIFLKVPIYIGIHKWTLDIIPSSNSENRYLRQSIFSRENLRSRWLCDSEKFLLSELESAFCLKSVWHWLVAVAWEDSILVQESTGSPFWPTSEPEEKLPRNCSWKIARNCKVRKVFAKKENGADDESAHFGPAQEYERVSKRKWKILEDIVRNLNFIYFCLFHISTLMLMTCLSPKGFSSTLPSNLTLCPPHFYLSELKIASIIEKQSAISFFKGHQHENTFQGFPYLFYFNYS